MQTLILKPKHVFTVPVEVEKIIPDKVAGKSLGEILKLKVYEGNRKRTVGDLFEVSGEVASKPEEQEIIFQNSTVKLRRVGEKMTAGKIVVEGDVGPLAGYRMAGGTLIIKGNAGPWLGARMKKGTIEVFGNAGGFVGSKLRGEPFHKGMSGGMIIIHGNAGREVGAHMSGGKILVEGNAGVLPGLHMAKGNILIKGNCAGWPGTHMIGGKIIVLGHVDSMVPSFSFEGIMPKVKFAGQKISGPFYFFMGDLLDTEFPSGKLYILKETNKHLSFYEQFIEEVKDEWLEALA